MEPWFVLEWRYRCNVPIIHEIFLENMTQHEIQEAAVRTFNPRSVVLVLSKETMAEMRKIARSGLEDERRWTHDEHNMFDE
jgi:hypothetical protein